MRSTLSLTLAVVLLATAAPAAERRALKPEDVFALRDVQDPQLDPDGRLVAFTVRRVDKERDAFDTDLYQVPLAGGPALQLTRHEKSESRPRFSPDGRFLAFLAARDGKKTQVWLLDRQGGEPFRLTDYRADVSELAWSPDGKRLALVVSDVDPQDPDLAETKAGQEPPPRPIVILRRQFKRDGEGYLGAIRSHVHVFDVTARSSVQVTTGPYDDTHPVWAPDGRLIAFVSNRTEDPDANQNSDVFLVEARAGATPRRLTTAPGSDDSPAFSPDGALVAYLAGGDPKDMWYATNDVAVVPVAGGEPRPLTAALDRNVAAPRFSADGRHVYFLLEDAGNRQLARVPAAGGAVERVVAGERDVSAYALGPGGETVVLESQPDHPAELSVAEAGGLRRLSHVNDAFLEGIRLAPVERFRATSADGTPIDGFLTRPPDAPAGTRLPTILRIHGGPVGQYSTEFELEWQMLAAHGYAVVAANPRGSSGHGTAFSRAIWADWGRKDFADVMAAVDHAVAAGVADPERLGVGGWSYGGILTNYVITQTTRFKAAISGASEVNYTANYGTDHYQYEWEAELGLPWRNTELWLKLSPFFHVDEVKTPTLVMCGQSDMNVPLLNSEQLYQALRRLGVPTELVIYPGQNHGFRRPSFIVDRFERYLAWYDRYLMPQAASLLGRPLYAPEIAPDRRAVLELDLARARADYDKDPRSADAAIWLGRRLAYLGRYEAAIDVFTRAIEQHPDDLRLLRHRGHRYVTLRRLDAAIADLERAATLARQVPDAVEPDGDPNPAGVPTSTSHFNVFYHLGLARYLKGDFEGARAAYEECLRYSQASPDRLVATSDWLYRTLRRLGRDDEAARLLAPIRRDMGVIENDSYLELLLVYKGEQAADALLASDDPLDRATYGYAIGNWDLVNGRPDAARRRFEEVVAGPQWAAFGFIAAEAELARTR